MRIKIKTLMGKDLEIEVDNEATVLDLKKSIEYKEQISTQQQKLVHNGRVLSNENDLLKSHSLQNGSVIHMVIALRGG